MPKPIFTKLLKVKLPEFDNHVSVSFLYEPKTNLRAFVAVHRKKDDSPSFGATRILSYKSEIDALRDALRLSKTMSYKAVSTGLPCGGAKGVIMLPQGRQITQSQKRKILRSYAKQLNLWSGNFITGTDVGISQEDLLFMKRESNFLTGFSGEAARMTALGVFYSLESVFGIIFGKKSISKRSFAIQGLGKVGEELLELIYHGAKTIYISDADPIRVKKIKKSYPRVRVVSPKVIHKQKVDAFCPCALSGVVNGSTVGELVCAVVAGGANNQLSSESLGRVLFKRGIIYVPDYIANAGGLIAVYDEYHRGNFKKSRVLKKVKLIARTTEKIILASRKNGQPTNYITNKLAARALGQ